MASSKNKKNKNKQKKRNKQTNKQKTKTNYKKNILQHQQFAESLAELSEPNRIPLPVMTFAVVRSLVLMRLQL